ncbi:MAG: 3-deoxy-D-manno-octulosonic acid kinase [Woeseiaceae bacterium]|nr:3-deoxy-D-manno-octulosonic acid kinase [Woeseiaceae bacterium]
MTETVERTETGAILYDKAVINQITPQHFTPQGWPHSEPVSGSLRSAGRGNTMYVGNVPRQFVLRHYMRGGLVGKFNRDAYWFKGEDQTRPFLEWRILAKMADNGLRVPRPAAARYVRRGLFYTADIVTVRIPDVVPLSQHIEEARDAEFWTLLGASVHQFHEAGVYHADMNAYNLQIDANERLWMLDFDRGRLRQAGAWKQETLNRLHRSLQKIRSLNPRLHYGEPDWEAFLQGYFSASRSA